MAKILIVEDNESLRLAYSSILEQVGHDVTAVSNVDDGLTWLATNTPDMMLLDMLLPKKNGLSLLQQYDVRTAHPNVKVIAFSNYTEKQIKDEAERLGVRMYLTKSLTTPDDLVKTFNYYLDTK